MSKRDLPRRLAGKLRHQPNYHSAASFEVRSDRPTQKYPQLKNTYVIEQSDLNAPMYTETQNASQSELAFEELSEI